MSLIETGFREFSTAPNRLWIFVALFLGVVIHWLYEVAVAAIRNDGTWDFGNTGVVAARLFVSLVAAAFGFISAYNQIKKVDQEFRFVSAFTLGLGVDALTTPWTTATATAPVG